MSDLPVTRFVLELKLADKPPRAVMSDSRDDATALADVDLDPAPPYTIGMAFSADGSTGGLKPELTKLATIPAPRPRPFDPALAGDDGVLSIDWHFVKPLPQPKEPPEPPEPQPPEPKTQAPKPPGPKPQERKTQEPQRKTDAPLRTVHDRWIETQDKATLRIFLTNRSHYYEADDLKITIRAKLPDGSEPAQRPDGNELLSIWPDVQAARSIPPQDTRPFDYLVVTRGPRAGLYMMEVHVDYKLVYVYRELCQSTTAIAQLPLHIHGGSAPPLPGQLRPLPATDHPQLERISSQRRLHMSEQDFDRGHSGKHELHPIERRVLLTGGGELSIMYRLVKGSHTRPDDSRPRYGWNPSTKEAESYFSTADEAAMEITIHNMSGLHLRHIHLDNVSLFHQNQDGSKGLPVDGRLPDGNLLFEVLPDEVYFGSLLAGERRTRYLGLVTRGVRAGHFLVHFDVRYEIVDGIALVNLPVTVRPD